jgi:hypothetical protein
VTSSFHSAGHTRKRLRGREGNKQQCSIQKIKINTIILHAVFYGYETWSLTLKEEHRLSMSESRVLWGIFGTKREKVAGGWRRLHIEELHNLYDSPNIIMVIKSRKMRWAGLWER